MCVEDCDIAHLAELVNLTGHGWNIASRHLEAEKEHYRNGDGKHDSTAHWNSSCYA